MKKGCLVIVALCAVMAVGFVGVGYFVLKATNAVDVEWTEADFSSFLDKGGLEYKEDYATIEEIISGDFEAKGASEVSTSFSNEEITAALNKATRPNSPLRDIRVKFRDDGKVEASGVISDNLGWLYDRYPGAKEYERYISLLSGRTVKVVSSLEYSGNNNFDTHIDKAYLGHIPLPVDIVNSYTGQLEAEINKVLGNLENLQIEEFSFDSSGLNFEGIVPVEFKSIS